MPYYFTINYIMHTSSEKKLYTLATRAFLHWLKFPKSKIKQDKNLGQVINYLPRTLHCGLSFGDSVKGKYPGWSQSNMVLYSTGRIALGWVYTVFFRSGNNYQYQETCSYCWESRSHCVVWNSRATCLRCSAIAIFFWKSLNFSGSRQRPKWKWRCRNIFSGKNGSASLRKIGPNAYGRVQAPLAP